MGPGRWPEHYGILRVDTELPSFGMLGDITGTSPQAWIDGIIEDRQRVVQQGVCWMRHLFDYLIEARGAAIGRGREAGLIEHPGAR